MTTAHTDRDDELGALDLDDMPGIPPLVRNARVAADLLFVDPPAGAYVVSTHPDKVTIQCDAPDVSAWASRHGLYEDDDRSDENFRAHSGHIEGVAFTVLRDLPWTTCDKPSCDNHAEPNTAHGLCPSCLDARRTQPLTAYDVILGAPEGAL